MKTRVRFVLVVAAAAVVMAAPAAAAAGPKEDVVAAARAWADAFSRHDLEGLLGLYDAEAVFWGTSSPVLRDTPAAIRDYFKGLPNARMVVSIGEHRARVLGDVAIVTGHYTFTDTRDGRTTDRPARFSLTFRLRDGRWLIVDHHSSAVPTPAR